MRIAAIDIGTNSVHMIVARVRPDFSFEIIDREKEMVRLGAGGLDGRKLTQEAMSAALQALSKFERLARSHPVDAIVAAATSATREAENGGEFLRVIERQTGIRPRIISGTEEARLIHLAAVYGVDTPTPSVVIDIGGGSVEITLGSREASLAESFKIGVIRLTERFVKSDPLTRRDERRMVRHIEEQVGAHIARIVDAGYTRVIGTSGTILSLGTVACALECGSPPAEVRNLRVPAKSLHRVRKVVTEQVLKERVQLPGMDPKRADLAVAGAVLIDTLLKQLQADDITLCDLALREGLILDYINAHRREIARADQYPDVRRRSAIELAERSSWEEAHSKQVAQLALQLFDGTRGLHGLGDRERELLELAGLLHDVGNHISYERHHRHSYYLIKNGDLRGFEPEEIEIIALTTRYHRRGGPKRSHEGYRDLPSAARRIVRVLAGCLQMAESLDRSKNRVVKELVVRERPDHLLVELGVRGDAELEVWSANRHLGELEGVLKRTMRLEVRHVPSAPPTPPRASSAPLASPRRRRPGKGKRVAAAA